MVFRTAEELKQAYAQSLREQGKGVSLDVPVGEHGITIDILTDSEMIVCRPELTEQTATEVKSQLTFYGQFGPRWQKVVVVEHVTRPYEVERLAAANIQVVTLPQSRTTAIVRVPKKVEPSFQYSATDDYLSFEGGTGSKVAFCAVMLIFILGIIGVIASRQQQPRPASLQSSPYGSAHKISVLANLRKLLSHPSVGELSTAPLTSNEFTSNKIALASGS